jgi:hypothetical protein
LLKLIIKKSKNNSIICYWNNLAKRDSHKTIKNLYMDNDLSKILFKEDKTALFYSKFIVDKIKN